MKSTREPRRTRGISFNPADPYPLCFYSFCRLRETMGGRSARLTTTIRAVGAEEGAGALRRAGNRVTHCGVITAHEIGETDDPDEPFIVVEHRSNATCGRPAQRNPKQTTDDPFRRARRQLADE